MRYINYASVLISIILFLMFLLLKPKKHITIILVVYFGIMATIEVTSLVLAKIHKPNAFVFYIYTICEITLTGLFYFVYCKQVIKKQNLAKNVFWFVLLALSILLVINLFTKRIDFATTFTSSVVLVFMLTAMYFSLEVTEKDVINRMFIISTFLMHGISIMALLNHSATTTLSLSNQVSIYTLRSLVFLIAKLTILVPLVVIVTNPNLEKPTKQYEC